MNNKDDKGDNFRAAMAAAGATPSGIAAEFGVSPQVVNNWLKRGVPASRAIDVAGYLNTDPQSISSVTFDAGRAKMRDLIRETEAVYGSSKVTDLGVVMIPEIDISVSLGSGNHGATSSKIVEHWPVEAKLLYRLGVDPGQAVIVRCAGESMSGSIEDGDLVVVDKGASSPPWNGVYAIQSDSGIRIKRLNLRLDGTVEVISDNPNKDRYPTEVYDNEFAESTIAVLGQVVRKLWGKVV